MNIYKVKHNTVKKYLNVKQIIIEQPINIEAEYTITRYGFNFVNIARYVKNPKTVANLVCKLLNKEGL